MKTEFLELSNGTIAKLYFNDSSSDDFIKEKIDQLKKRKLSDDKINNTMIIFCYKLFNIEFYFRPSNSPIKSNFFISGWML